MTGQFLIFSSLNTAWAKAEEEGKAVLPNGWNGNGAKFVSSPDVLHRENEEDELSYALDVSDYTTLTVGETESIVTDVTFGWEMQ